MKIFSWNQKFLSRAAIAKKAAFTLTEIALCIAVVGVALVAIIGVLPSGLTVQRQNREDTLVTEDARYLMETLKSGALGMFDLTNYVEQIRWIRLSGSGQAITNTLYGFHSPHRGPGDTILTNPMHIVGLLSLPRVVQLPNSQQIVTNIVQAEFRSFGSAFTDKPYSEAGGTRPSAGRMDNAFRYLVTPEFRSAATRPVNTVGRGTNVVERGVQLQQQFLLDQSLNELALTFQWPVYRVGNDIRTGNSRKVYRTQVYGYRQNFEPNFMGTGQVLSRIIPATAETFH